MPDRGIIHRDIKPANLFLARAPDSAVERVVVLDFGVAELAAHHRDASTPAIDVAGTPEFMAPEQARGEPCIDGRADIYALGCTLFMTIAGRPPFVADGLADVLRAHQDGTPPSLTDFANCPPGLDRLLARCLAKDPDDRWRDMRSLRQGLLDVR